AEQAQGGDLVGELAALELRAQPGAERLAPPARERRLQPLPAVGPMLLDALEHLVHPGRVAERGEADRGPVRDLLVLVGERLLVDRARIRGGDLDQPADAPAPAGDRLVP